jgi:hypothetical protein
MKAHEFVVEKKKRKRRPRYAAYGPGPYGDYGYATGYSIHFTNTISDVNFDAIINWLGPVMIAAGIISPNSSTKVTLRMIAT